VYFEQQQFNEALKLYLEAVKYKPDYADALMNIGSCYGVGQQYDLAIQYLEKAVAADPGLSQAYYFIGITYRNKGNEALAQQYIQRSQQVADAKNAK
jgi:tetratricopeptide (TPR) repeat protein